MVIFEASYTIQWDTIDTYMRENYKFHFALYRSSGSEVLVPLLESVWMQFGPFMRTIFDMTEKSDIVDKHKMALEAIRREDAEALGLAIQADIMDAVHLLRQTLGDQPDAGSDGK